MAEDPNYWTDKYRPGAFSRRLSRRRLIQLSGVGAAGALAAAYLGCGDDDGTTGDGSPGAVTETPPPGVSAALEEYRTKYRYDKLAAAQDAAGQPKYGGTFHFSHYQGFTGAWDITGPEGDALASFAPNHYNGLVTFPMDDYSNAHNLYEVVGDLAESFEANDETTVTFKLNQGVKFHNVPPVGGREMTAEDVKYCAEVYKTSVAQFPTFSEVESVDTPDKYTAVFRFAKPAAYFLQSLTYPVNSIFAREAYEQKDTVFVKQPIGTGAFVLDKWDPPNVYSGKKHAEYFKKDPRTNMQLPYLDGFEAPILNLQTNLEEAAFRDGNLDTIWNHFKTNFDNMLDAFPDSVGQVTTPPPGYEPYITLKLDKPPFNDPKVRQALQQMIDTQAIIDGPAEGLAAPGLAHDYSFFGQEFPWTLQEIIDMGGNFVYDPQAAQQLLSAAGLSDGIGRTLKIMYGTGDALQAEVFRSIVAFWRQGGIDVEIDEVPITDIARYNAAFFGKEWGDLDAIGFGFAGPGMDVDQYTYGPLNSNSLRNFFWVDDAQIDQLTEQQRREFDLETRRSVVMDIIKRELEQSFRIWGILPYKLAVRRGYAFNVVDTIHAWGNIGWGSKSEELVWLSEA